VPLLRTEQLQLVASAHASAEDCCVLFSELSAGVTVVNKMVKTVKACVCEPTSELRSVTCHMGSRNVTCHPTQANAPRLNPSHVHQSREVQNPNHYCLE